MNMKICREGAAIALIHEFVQIAPDAVARGFDPASDDACDYCRQHPPEMRMYVLQDDVVLRNLGGSGDSPRFFSSFTSRCAGEALVGLNYWGVTLLDTEVLTHLTSPPDRCGVIHPRDKYAIGLFRRFCEQTLAEGLWLVHFGI